MPKVMDVEKLNERKQQNMQSAELSKVKDTNLTFEDLLLDLSMQISELTNLLKQQNV